MVGGVLRGELRWVEIKCIQGTCENLGGIGEAKCNVPCTFFISKYKITLTGGSSGACCIYVEVFEPFNVAHRRLLISCLVLLASQQILCQPSGSFLLHSSTASPKISIFRARSLF